MGRSVRSDIDLREYRDDDEDGVLALLSASLGPGPTGARSRQFFRWKHLANPFGRSHMIVAESEGKIVGLRAFLRWRFSARSTVVHAVRAVDTATHPDFQGRGIFTRLTLRALDDLHADTQLVFNTPNERAYPAT